MSKRGRKQYDHCGYVTMEAIRACVAEGAKLLDARHPEWAAKIDVSRLDVGDLKSDVLGQLYGDVWRGERALTGLDWDADRDAILAWGHRYGFGVPWNAGSEFRRAIPEFWADEVRTRTIFDYAI